MIDDEVRGMARKLFELLRAGNLKLVTAESCTGGLIAAAITDIPGSSDVLERGFITYSNAAKESDLGVPAQTLSRHGAVSEATARAMAEGALNASPADLSVAVTGIAGPTGGSAEKPVGLVHFAAARRDGSVLHREVRFGDIGRSEVRRRSVVAAMALVEEILNARR
ncbi:MAG: CinA family protein [Xanthobacteraceae bacterium]